MDYTTGWEQPYLYSNARYANRHGVRYSNEFYPCEHTSIMPRYNCHVQTGLTKLLSSFAPIADVTGYNANCTFLNV